ncbi:MAG: hypothetical protein QOF94_3064 [Acidobacteriaceae bacterium]|jgi:hypothetical protein
MPSFRGLVVCGLALFLLCIPTLAQQTPSADAYTDTAYPSTNFGNGATLNVYSPSQNDLHPV